MSSINQHIDDEKRLLEIRKRVYVRDDSNAMNSACGEYNCPCHYDMEFLLSLIDQHHEINQQDS